MNQSFKRNQSIKRKMTASLAASLGLAFFPVPSAWAVPHVKMSAAADASWLPDKALTMTLGPQTDLAGYKMRLPAGYTADVKKDEATGPFKARFFSLHKSDNVGPTMFVMAVSLSASAADASHLPAMAERLFDGDGYTHGKKGLVKTQPQMGLINGLRVARQYFKYMGADGHERHGFHYGVVDGAKRLLIIVVDEEPYSTTSLPLAEAAVLTLRR